MQGQGYTIIERHQERYDTFNTMITSGGKLSAQEAKNEATQRAINRSNESQPSYVYHDNNFLAFYVDGAKQ